MDHRVRLASILVVGIAVGFTVAGCGSGADPTRGRELFQSGTNGKLSCGFCHTLRAAATVGPLAPDLDQEGREYARLGWSDGKIRKFVLHQMHRPTCDNPDDPSRCMPTDLVTGGDAASVAAFISKCAGKSGTPGCQPFPGGLTGEARQGQLLYTKLGCVSCHSIDGNVAVAPTFKGLAGSQVELASGKNVTADDAYLLQSIVLPDRDIVKGFQAGYMTQRILPGQVTADQAKALIAYIKAQK